MTRSYLLVTAALLGLAACGSQKRAPARAPGVPPPAATAPARVDDVPEKAALEWTYSSAGKRDPFRSYLAEVEAAGRGISSRCPTPLGRFGVDQLRLVAVVTGLDDPVAMVEAPNGVGYSLRRGACVGRNGGVIAAVRSGEVVISEWVIRADGSRDKTQTILRLPKEASLNIEE